MHSELTNIDLLPLNSNSTPIPNPPKTTTFERDNEKPSLEVEVLGDLLRQFFNDNLTLDQKVDLLRDENLGLKSELFHALCGISDALSEDDELGLEEQQEVIGGLLGDLRRLNRRNGRPVESRRTTRMRSGRTTNAAVS